PAAGGAVRAVLGADLPRVQRAFDQPVAEHRAAEPVDPRRRRAAPKCRLRARRRAGDHPHHPCLYNLELLGLQRQGEGRGCRLSPLRPRRMAEAASRTRLWLRRIAWLIALWTASVATLAAAAWLLRALMRAAGMTS